MREYLAKTFALHKLNISGWNLQCSERDESLFASYQVTMGGHEESRIGNIPVSFKPTTYPSRFLSFNIQRA